MFAVRLGRVAPICSCGSRSLRVIAAETSAWTIETGGDLFGRWQDILLRRVGSLEAEGIADQSRDEAPFGLRAKRIEACRRFVS